VGTREDIWTGVAGGLVVIIAVLDAATGGEGFQGVLLAGPVVASATISARRTAAVAAITVAAGLLVGAVHGRLDDFDHIVRVAGLVLTGGFCVVGARWRERRERDLARVTKVAEVAQLAILRPIPNRVGPVAFASRYVSAAEQAFIGGDLYEVVPGGEGVRVVVGDVRGKGLEAVHLAALVLGAFREAAGVEQALEQVAAAVDRAVAGEITLEDFVTALFVEFLPGGEVRVVNCGHHPPLRLTDRTAEYLTPTEANPPLGLAPDFVVEVHHLDRGDRLLLYTDGLVEARSRDRRFFELAPEVLASLGRRGLDTALENLVAQVLRHSGGRLDDDLALLLAELRS
jgi:sigma-B regulation protein RsbU (phosphoserine phosphatase)